MLSKDEERNLLRQIKKRIEAAGEGSYIAIAFEGCVKDAEDNIENDFGNSWYIRAQNAEKKAEQAEAKAAKAEADAAFEKERADAAEETLVETQKECHASLAKIEKLENEKKLLNLHVEYWYGETMQADKEAAEARKEAEALRQQVAELKARLYDLMTKG